MSSQGRDPCWRRTGSSPDRVPRRSGHGESPRSASHALDRTSRCRRCGDRSPGPALRCRPEPATRAGGGGAVSRTVTPGRSEIFSAKLDRPCSGTRPATWTPSTGIDGSRARGSGEADTTTRLERKADGLRSNDVVALPPANVDGIGRRRVAQDPHDTVYVPLGHGEPEQAARSRRADARSELSAARWRPTDRDARALHLPVTVCARAVASPASRNTAPAARALALRMVLSRSKTSRILPLARLRVNHWGGRAGRLRVLQASDPAP